MFARINSVCRLLSKISSWLQKTMLSLTNNVYHLLMIAINCLKENSVIVTTIATVFLAAFTFSYLRETKKQRLLTQKIVLVQTSPKVFIKNIESTVHPDYDTNELVVHSTIIFTNCGITEAKNIDWSYTIKQDEQELVKKDKRRAPHIYPEQNRATAITVFRIKRNPEEMKIIKKAQELNKPITISPSVLKPVILDIEFGYEDPDGKKIPNHQEQYKYLLDRNEWVIPTTED